MLTKGSPIFSYIGSFRYFSIIRFGLPSFFTGLRVVLAIFICLQIVSSNWKMAVALFFLASTTDYFDGLSARFFNAQTTFGRWFDICADKFFILSIATTLLIMHVGYKWQWVLWVILIREISLILASMYCIFFKDAIVIQACRAGKIAMAIQFSLIGMLLFEHAANKELFDASLIKLICCGTMLSSFLSYGRLILNQQKNK